IITTLGAIGAACIQTGIISKSPTINVSDFVPSLPPTTNAGFVPTAQPSGERYSMARPSHSVYAVQQDTYLQPAPRIASAAFVGTIEPVRDVRSSDQESGQTLQPSSSPNMPAPKQFVPSESSWPAPSAKLSPDAAVNTAAYLPTTDDMKMELTAGYAPA